MERKMEKPLGVKQLAGPGASRLPTLKRREQIRQASNDRQTSSRERLMNKNRGIDHPQWASASKTVEKTAEDEERKQALLRQLEEYKAQKAKKRQEEIRSRRKPFVCGIARPSPCKTDGMASSVTKKTPKIDRSDPKVKNETATRSGQRAVVKSLFAGTKLPKPSLPTSKISLVPKPVASKTASGTTGAGAATVKKDAANSTYDILSVALSETSTAGLNRPIAQANDATETHVKEIEGGSCSASGCNEAGGGDAGASAQLQQISSNITVDAKATWNPGATSSPCNDDGGDDGNANQKPWYNGIDTDFTFTISSVETIRDPVPPDAAANIPKKSPELRTVRKIDFDDCIDEKTGRIEGSQVPAGGSSGTSVDQPSTIPKGESTKPELPKENSEQEVVRKIDFDEGAMLDAVSQDCNRDNGDRIELLRSTIPKGTPSVVKKKEEPLDRSRSPLRGDTDSVRRSTRITRYTGSFKGQDSIITPRRRRTNQSTPKPSGTEADVETESSEEDTEEGIMDVSPPELLQSAGLSPSPPAASNANIMTDLANLSLSTVEKNDQHRANDTCKFEPLDSTDEEDDFITACLPDCGDNNTMQRSLSESDLSRSSPSATPQVQFTAPPVTPAASILRKDTAGQSTQKKSVRFRNSSVGVRVQIATNSTMSSTPMGGTMAAASSVSGRRSVSATSRTAKGDHN